MNKQNQNKIFVIGFVLVGIVIAWSLMRPAVLRFWEKEDGEKKINAEIMKAPLITSADLYEKLKNKENIYLVDMRTEGNFLKGHLALSQNIAADSLDAEILNSLGAQKTAGIILLNQGDDVLETARKTNELILAGYPNAKYLQGGVSAWQRQGYALISSSMDASAENKIKKISLEKLTEDLSSGTDSVQFIDVRSREFFKKGHIAGAANISLSDIEKSQEGISPARKVVVYSNDENEAARAAVTLFDLNFFNIYVLEGGLDAWKSAGGMVE